jgi:hypothetical protein
MVRTNYIRWSDNDILFVLNQHFKLDFYNAGPLKQHSTGQTLNDIFEFVISTVMSHSEFFFIYI